MAKVKCGLIQMSLKGDGSMTPEAIRDRMIEAHIPYIEDAGRQGVAGTAGADLFVGSGPLNEAANGNPGRGRGW